MKLSKTFQNESGMSLIELMVSTMIASIVMAASTAFMIFTVQQLKYVNEKLETEENLILASHYINQWLSQGVDVNSVGNFTDVANSSGAFIGSNTDSWATLGDGSSVPIANFLMENSEGGLSSFVHRSIIFNSPSGNNPNHPVDESGAIVMDMGGNGPDAGDIVFNRFVRIQTQSQEINGFITNAQITLTARLFPMYNQGTWTARQGEANAGRDIERTFLVSFRNNMVSNSTNVSVTGMTQTQHLQGGVYFFKPILPVGFQSMK